MRNIRAEKIIDKTLAMRFFLDTSRYDVTVLDDHAEINGDFVVRTTGQPMGDRELKDMQRYFKPGVVEGVKRYIFHQKQMHTL